MKIREKGGTDLRLSLCKLYPTSPFSSQSTGYARPGIMSKNTQALRWMGLTSHHIVHSLQQRSIAFKMRKHLVWNNILSGSFVVRAHIALTDQNNSKTNLTAPTPWALRVHCLRRFEGLQLKEIRTISLQWECVKNTINRIYHWNQTLLSEPSISVSLILMQRIGKEAHPRGKSGTICLKRKVNVHVWNMLRREAVTH